MASTFSPNLRLELIGTGEQQGTWGATTNVNLGTLLEEAIGGYVSVTVSDVADTTLTANNGSADQSRNMVLNLTGTISAARNVICPAIEKLYVVKNATTGGYAVTIKVSGQTGVSVPNGSTVFVYVDGTDVRAITGSAALQSIGTSGATVPLLNGTNTWSSSQTFSASLNRFGSGSGQAYAAVNGGAGFSREFVYQTNGTWRWSTGATATAEAGSNLGSNFAVARFDDAGNYIDIPLQITRSSGVTTIKELNLTTPLAIGQGGTGATSNSAARTNLGLGTAATQNTGTSGANVPLLNGANVWSGAQIFGTGSGDAFVNINGGAASTRGVVTASNGSARWLYGVDNSAESGSNAGSSFFFNRHDDSGTYIDTPLSISRATGVTALQSLSLNTDLAITHGGTGASDPAGARANLGLGGLAVLNAVGTTEITDLSVTTGKIADGAVTSAKLAAGVIPSSFPSGTKLLFQQTNAPTGWTKDTTHNNKALRVVNGAVSSGGTVAFTTAFASQAVAGTVGNQTATGTVSGTVGDTALTQAQIPSHSHTFSARTGTGGNSGLQSTTGLGSLTTITTSAEGSGAVHTHTFSGSFTGVAHTHTFTGTAIDLAVQYVDVIIATKD